MELKQDVCGYTRKGRHPLVRYIDRPEYTNIVKHQSPAKMLYDAWLSEKLSTHSSLVVE